MREEEKGKEVKGKGKRRRGEMERSRRKGKERKMDEGHEGLTGFVYLSLPHCQAKLEF